MFQQYLRIMQVKQKQYKQISSYIFLATVILNNRKYILNLFDSAGQVKKDYFEYLNLSFLRKNMINFVSWLIQIQMYLFFAFLLLILIVIQIY